MSALFLIALVVAVSMATPARSERAYSLDQRFGRIGFSVGHLGLFTSSGHFERFKARLILDRLHPGRTRISVDVDAGSVDMPWHDGATMLRSRDFFDVAQYPDIRFVSTAVRGLAPDRYLIRGTITIRGIARPLVLDARLVKGASAHDAETADFVVTGHLKRSAFGMTSDRIFISNVVGIKINMRIDLGQVARAG